MCRAGNYQAIQIAVIYDHDGSVTDMMLGEDASDPSGCRQNAVTESVDSISTSGFIQHAVLVLNGRCTGSAPEQQLQMQYQLMRAFGRVLGLGWSQTNDNVFTSTPVPTYDQAMHWPVMHPIDIICGTYTYQCMPQPFTLRYDDLSALAELYMIGQGQAQAGQTDTLLNASQILGYLSFPNGQGMQGVNCGTEDAAVREHTGDVVHRVIGVGGEVPALERQPGDGGRYIDERKHGPVVGLFRGGIRVRAGADHLRRLAVHHPRDGADESTVCGGVFGWAVYGQYGGAFGERSGAADRDLWELCDYGWLDLATIGAASTCVTGDGGSRQPHPRRRLRQDGGRGRCAGMGMSRGGRLERSRDGV